jgi:sugar phosphate isomerase/epimerase
MKKQAFQERDDEIIERFIEVRGGRPPGGAGLNFSWSNWGFGIEPFERSVERLARHGVPSIELHGNRYGPDLGYRASHVGRVLEENGIRVSGICGMVSADSELASNRPHVRQRAIDYFRRQIELCVELRGAYVLFAPGAVGRTQAPDRYEYERAAESIRIIAEDFHRHGIRGAVEPVRAAEVSFCHTFADARKLIDMVDHPGVRHIAGDVYHILAGEEHVAGTLIDYGEMLTNLHLADSNRLALGRGVLDLDMVIMALYVIGYDNESCFCTAEPLGPGGDPYPQMYGLPDADFLDDMVRQTAETFRERERAILEASDEELRR